MYYKFNIIEEVCSIFICVLGFFLFIGLYWRDIEEGNKIINNLNEYIICFVKYYVGVLGLFWNIDKEV